MERYLLLQDTRVFQATISTIYFRYFHFFFSLYEDRYRVYVDPSRYFFKTAIERKIYR